MTDCRICNEVLSILIPLTLNLLVCATCGTIVICAFCACLPWPPRSEEEDVMHRGSPSRSDAARRSHLLAIDRIDDIRRAEYLAQLISNSLATTKVITVAILPFTIPMDASLPEELADVTLDEEHGLPSFPDSTANGARTCLVLESTGWEVNACAICIEQYHVNDLVSYSKKQTCDHNFHTECIKSWLKVKHDCPCCRSPYG